jgi:hypothetical protein
MILTSIKAPAWPPGEPYPFSRSNRGDASMSPIEIGYLALVLVAFGCFAVTLAYYNHHAN